jgi:hypothetical protein
MIDRREAALTVVLTPTPATAPGVRNFAATSDGFQIAEIATTPIAAGIRVFVRLTSPTLPEREDLGALIAAIVALGRPEDSPAIQLVGDSDLRLRYYARAAGFTAPLRANLALDLRAPAPPERAQDSIERFLADLVGLLPGVEITTARPPGVLRSYFRGASSGIGGLVHLTARGPTDIDALRLAIPVTDDVMAEAVALMIDTALAIRSRFRPLVDGVRVIYDHSAHGLRTGKLAGAAEANVRDVHLNPAYAQMAEMEALDRPRWERAAGSEPGGRHSSRTLAPPFTRIDAVVAHEFWHQIEFGFEGARYRDSVEFRRSLGAYFGVETLEHAFKGGHAGDPLSWQVARTRLATEVSDYATTAPKEATAELFTQWWCTAAAPPPSAEFFATLLKQFFPPVDGGRSR